MHQKKENAIEHQEDIRMRSIEEDQKYIRFFNVKKNKFSVDKKSEDKIESSELKDKWNQFGDFLILFSSLFAQFCISILSSLMSQILLN